MELAQAEADYRYEFQACQALEELAATDSTPVAVVPVAVVPVAVVPVAVVPVKAEAKAPRVRCDYYKAIRRCYAIARDAGLDVSKAGKARMRHAFETVAGQGMGSRSEYSGI